MNKLLKIIQEHSLRLHTKITESLETKVLTFVILGIMLIGFLSPFILGNTSTELHNAPIKNTSITSPTTNRDSIQTTMVLEGLTREKTLNETPEILKDTFAIAFNNTEETTSKNSLTTYIANLRSLRNYLLIDILSILDGSSNRNVLYEQYITELRSIAIKSTSYLSALQNEIALLKNEYNDSENLKKDHRNKYSDSLKNYDGETAYSELQAFIESQKTSGEKFALYTSLESILDSYNSILKAVDRKLTFLEANRDAIIKNVKVVDIKEFHNELILSESEWKGLLGR